MSFYLEPLSFLDRKETQAIAEKTNKGFYALNGDLMHRNERIGQLTRCIDEKGGLKNAYIFNTDHKSWGLDKAHSTFLESGYPFMSWNGQLYDKECRIAASLVEVKHKNENKNNEIFISEHKSWGHINEAAEFIKTTGYPKMEWNGHVYDVEVNKTAKPKMK